jgi:transcriptional regulator with XRE-family HTH domain
MPAKRRREGAEPAAEEAARGRELGVYLANIRSVKKLTLREVEEATGREVSNAYLSQLETGKIARPSPNVLHALAKVYGVPYETLMDKAGYFSPAAPVASQASSVLRSAGSPRKPASALANEGLTPEEEEKLLEYLAFLRSRHSRGKGR